MKNELKKIKIRILKSAIQLVYQCAEYTPPEIKSSDHNLKVGRAVAAIESVIKSIK